MKAMILDVNNPYKSAESIHDLLDEARSDGGAASAAKQFGSLAIDKHNEMCDDVDELLKELVDIVKMDTEEERVKAVLDLRSGKINEMMSCSAVSTVIAMGATLTCAVWGIEPTLGTRPRNDEPSTDEDGNTYVINKTCDDHMYR